jgi:hypothetical protein
VGRENLVTYGRLSQWTIEAMYFGKRTKLIFLRYALLSGRGFGLCASYNYKMVSKFPRVCFDGPMAKDVKRMENKSKEP